MDVHKMDMHKMDMHKMDMHKMDMHKMKRGACSARFRSQEPATVYLPV